MRLYTVTGPKQIMPRVSDPESAREIIGEGTPGNPVSSGELADSERSLISRVLDVIATDLWDHARSGSMPDPSPFVADSALFFGYMERIFPDCRYREKARFCIDKATETVRARSLGPSLFGGYVGIAWAIEHLDRIMGLDVADDFAREVDTYLCCKLADGIWMQDFDLAGGLVGFGIFALELKSGGEVCLSSVVDQLEALALTEEDGIWWHTSPLRMSAQMARRFPGGYHNLGVAHGLAGVLPVLAGAVTRDVNARKARILLEAAVRRLLRFKGDEAGASVFPRWISRDGRRTESGVGWCHGDAGIAAALLASARAVADPSLEKPALDLADSLARRDPDRFGIKERTLCHGAAGVTHLSTRIVRAGGTAALRETARTWLHRTLEPYRSVTNDPAPPLPQRGVKGEAADPHRSLLLGSVGVGLTLISTLHEDIVPEWDVLLGASIRAAKDGGA